MKSIVILVNLIFLLLLSGATAQQLIPTSLDKKSGKPDDYYSITSLFKTIDSVSYEYPYNREKSEWNTFSNNFLVVFTKPKTDINPLIFIYLNKLTNIVRSADINQVSSLDSCLIKAQAVFKDVVPTGEEFKNKEGTVVEANARAEYPAYILEVSLSGAVLQPAACFPGVRTYLHVNSSSDKPLWLAPNFKIWKGELYLDGSGKISIKEGTLFQLLEQ